MRALAVAAAWGWQGRMAESLVRKALSAGPMATDAMVRVLTAVPEGLTTAAPSGKVQA